MKNFWNLWGKIRVMMIAKKKMNMIRIVKMIFKGKRTARRMLLRNQYHLILKSSMKKTFS